MVDSQTLGVLTTLMVDVIGLVLILLGFMLIRSCRGDKQKHQSDVIAPELNDFVFDENFDSQKVEEQLEIEDDLNRRKTIDMQWEVAEEDSFDDKQDNDTEQQNATGNMLEPRSVDQHNALIENLLNEQTHD